MIPSSLVFVAALSAFSLLPDFLLPVASAAGLIAAVCLVHKKRTVLLLFFCFGIACGAADRIARPVRNFSTPGFYNGTVSISGFPVLRRDGQYEVNAERGRLKIVSPDGHLFYRTQKIAAAGYLRGRDGRRAVLYLKESRTVEPGFPLFRLVSRLRRFVTDQIRTVENPVSRALLSAMVLGHPDGLGFEALQVFRMTGLSHLLAVSGLNVAILAAGVLAVSGLFLNRRISFLLAAGIVFAYAGAAGCSASIMRAAVMFLIYSGLKVMGRPADLLDAILFSAVPVLAYDPGFLTDLGFWLSYGSVLGIYFFYSLFRSFILPSVPMISDGVSVTLAASVPTLPVQLLFFRGFSPYFLISNLAAVPIFALVTYGVFVYLATLFIPLPAIRIVLDTALNVLWSACLITADFVSRLPFGFIDLPEGWNTVAASMISFLSAVLLAYRPARFRMALDRARVLAAVPRQP